MLLLPYLGLLLGAWVVAYPGGWLVRRMLRQKKRQLPGEQQAVEQPLAPSSRGFPDGGAVIGRLERLLIYVFVMAGELSAVGFLVAAKGVFRFGELSNQDNRLEAEYIIIGTLASFATGLILSLAWRELTPVLLRSF